MTAMLLLLMVAQVGTIEYASKPTDRPRDQLARQRAHRLLSTGSGTWQLPVRAMTLC